VKRLKSAEDYNREQNKLPTRSDHEIVGDYFKNFMAKIAIDGDDETYEAKANQADMDAEEPNERTMDNITDVMMKSMMGTTA
jgi:hypothetical protein